MGPSREAASRSQWNRAKDRAVSHVFRAWTALAVLAGYAYGWFYAPEILTWWKRTTNAIIEGGSALLPYPWGDRVEATIGNFGLWVQITLAIVAFRILVWMVLSVVRGIWRRRGRRRLPYQ